MYQAHITQQQTVLTVEIVQDIAHHVLQEKVSQIIGMSRDNHKLQPTSGITSGSTFSNRFPVIKFQIYNPKEKSRNVNWKHPRKQKAKIQRDYYSSPEQKSENQPSDFIDQKIPKILSFQPEEHVSE
jgi:hypothetical protein